MPMLTASPCIKGGGVKPKLTLIYWWRVPKRKVARWGWSQFRCWWQAPRAKCDGEAMVWWWLGEAVFDDDEGDNYTSGQIRQWRRLLPLSLGTMSCWFQYKALFLSFPFRGYFISVYIYYTKVSCTVYHISLFKFLESKSKTWILQSTEIISTTTNDNISQIWPDSESWGKKQMYYECFHFRRLPWNLLKKSRLFGLDAW